MQETSKSIFFKLKDSRYATRYLIGDGVDISVDGDYLGQYTEFFPLIQSCRAWEPSDGNCQDMASIEDNVFDFVHASYSLQNLIDAKVGVNNWLRILKPGGHLICIVPDEDLYEQGVFPSNYSFKHKNTFTIYKKSSWSSHSINIFDLIKNLDYDVEVKKIELLDSTYRFTSNQRVDQTMTPVGQSAIEFVLRKR